MIRSAKTKPNKTKNKTKNKNKNKNENNEIQIVRAQPSSAQKRTCCVVAANVALDKEPEVATRFHCKTRHSDDELHAVGRLELTVVRVLAELANQLVALR